MDVSAIFLSAFSHFILKNKRNMFEFILGLVIGIVLSLVAISIEIAKDKRKLIWMDENYELHPVKTRKK